MVRQGVQDMTDSTIDHLLSIQEVQRITSLSKASIYRFISAGRFPRPVKLSPRGRSAWRASHVQVWTNDPLDWDEDFFRSD